MILYGTYWNIVVAERVGFEPTIQLPVYRFSRPALSSTQPSLREAGAASSRAIRSLPLFACQPKADPSRQSAEAVIYFII